MEKELKEAVKAGLCEFFMAPNKCNCGGTTKNECLNCAKEFMNGWNAHKRRG